MTIHRKVTWMAVALVGAVGAVAGFGAFAISQSTEFVEVDLRTALDGADGAMESRISMLKELWGATQVTGQANEASVKAGRERLRVEGAQFEAAFGELEESGVVPDATTQEIRQLHARFRKAADHLMQVRHRVDSNMEALDARTERIVARGIEAGASARFVDQLWRLTMAANDFAFTGLADALETYEALRPRVGEDLSRERGLQGEAGPYLEALDGLMAERKRWNQAYDELEGVATRLDTVLAVAEAGDEARDILGASGYLAMHVDHFREEVALSRQTQLVLTAFAVLVGVGFLLLGASIARRIGRLRDALARDPEDLTKRLEVDGDDELGDLAESVNDFIATVHTVVRSIADAAGTLGASAKGLSATSHQLTAEAQSVDTLTQKAATDVDQILDRIQVIASAIEQSSVNINQTASATQQIAAGVNGVAAGAEEMSTNIRTVASAVEELSASLAEVARSGSDSAEAGRESAVKTRDAAERIAVLAEAAARIGNVIALIEDIADQTNLLALNATIEAASAGEAGRGFSVVASEIKALARQTTHATEEIVQEVGAIRSATKSAVERIQEVTTDADRVDELASVIARAVEEQSSTTSCVSDNVASGAHAANEVSHSVSEISTSVDDVARQTTELAAGAEEISSSSSHVVLAARSVSSSIGKVRAAASETSEAAEEVARAALAGDQLASELQSLVSRFRL